MTGAKRNDALPQLRAYLLLIGFGLLQAYLQAELIRELNRVLSWMEFMLNELMQFPERIRIIDGWRITLIDFLRRPWTRWGIGCLNLVPVAIGFIGVRRSGHIPTVAWIAFVAIWCSLALLITMIL
jgi:hypothetical protein